MSEETKLILPLTMDKFLAGGLEPAVVSYNMQLDSMLNKYNYVVTDDNLDQAKKDKAALNKRKKEIHETASRLEKDILSAWTPIKTEIGGIENKIQRASDGLKEQIDAFEQERKDKKEAQCKEWWSRICGDSYPYSLIHDKKYLNAGSKEPAITQDMEEKYRRLESEWASLQQWMPPYEQGVSEITALYHANGDFVACQARAMELTRAYEQAQKAIQPKTVPEQKTEQKILDRVESAYRTFRFTCKTTPEKFQLLDDFLYANDINVLDVERMD